MSVAVVGELVVAGGELDEALGGDGGEVARELGVLGEDDRAAGHERVDQRLLPHGLILPFLARSSALLLPLSLPLVESELARLWHAGGRGGTLGGVG